MARGCTCSDRVRLVAAQARPRRRRLDDRPRSLTALVGCLGQADNRHVTVGTPTPRRQGRGAQRHRRVSRRAGAVGGRRRTGRRAGDREDDSLAGRGRRGPGARLPGAVVPPVGDRDRIVVRQPRRPARRRRRRRAARAAADPETRPRSGLAPRRDPGERR